MNIRFYKKDKIVSIFINFQKNICNSIPIELKTGGMYGLAFERQFRWKTT